MPSGGTWRAARAGDAASGTSAVALSVLLSINRRGLAGHVARGAAGPEPVPGPGRGCAVAPGLGAGGPSGPPGTAGALGGLGLGLPSCFLNAHPEPVRAVVSSTLSGWRALSQQRLTRPPIHQVRVPCSGDPQRPRAPVSPGALRSRSLCGSSLLRGGRVLRPRQTPSPHPALLGRAAPGFFRNALLSLLDPSRLFVEKGD